MKCQLAVVGMLIAATAAVALGDELGDDTNKTWEQRFPLLAALNFPAQSLPDDCRIRVPLLTLLGLAYPPDRAWLFAGRGLNDLATCGRWLRPDPE